MRPHTSAILLASFIPCLAMAQGAPLSTLERGAKIRLTAATVSESEKIGRYGGKKKVDEWQLIDHR